MGLVLFKSIRKFIVRPLVDWYSYWDTVNQFESLGALGAGVAANGPIRFGNPTQTVLSDDVSINSGLIVRGDGRLIIGSHVHFGEHITIVTGNHNFENPESLPYDKKRIAKDVRIGDAVWIGDRVLIIPGVTVGEGAILAAGAVVTRDVPPLAIVGGSPAELIRSRNEESYNELKSRGSYLNWPREYDLINGRRTHLTRRARDVHSDAGRTPEAGT